MEPRHSFVLRLLVCLPCWPECFHLHNKLCVDGAVSEVLPCPSLLLYLPLPHTTQSGRAQRALQSPSHKKPKALTFVSKDDGTPPLFCVASSGLFALLARVLSSTLPLHLSLPPPHTTHSGPSHMKPKDLPVVSKDDGTPPLVCVASSAIVCLADQSAFICKTGCALTEHPLKPYIAPIPLSLPPSPHSPTWSSTENIAKSKP